MANLSIYISCAALFISAITAWLTLFHKGTIKMTRPTVIYFGPDGYSDNGPKIFLRTLLYCTSRRGRIVESMYVRLRRNESSQIFNIWVYGDKDLSRGSGLYVAREGVVCNHHFLLPKDGTKYNYLPGDYYIDVYCQLESKNKPLLLTTQKVEIKEEWCEKLGFMNASLYFDWGPDSNQYQAHLDRDSTAELNYTLKEQIKGKNNTT